MTSPKHHAKTHLKQNDDPAHSDLPDSAEVFGSGAVCEGMDDGSPALVSMALKSELGPSKRRTADETTIAVGEGATGAVLQQHPVRGVRVVRVVCEREGCIYIQYMYIM